MNKLEGLNEEDGVTFNKVVWNSVVKINKYDFLKHLTLDKTYILIELITSSCTYLRYCNNEIKSNREVVLETIKQHGGALGYAHKSSQQDREVVLEAVQQYGGALVYAHKSFKKIEK